MSALTTVHPTAKKTSAKQNSHDDSKYPVRNLHCTETDLKSPTHIPASSDSSGMPRVRSNKFIGNWKTNIWSICIHIGTGFCGSSNEHNGQLKLQDSMQASCSGVR